MLNLRRIAAGSLHLWKREMKIATPNCSRFSSSPSDQKEKKRRREKVDVYEKLRSLTVETIDYIVREEEEMGVSVTQADLFTYARRLDDDGKSEYALKIFEWMDKKKMKLSPDELAIYVDLVAEYKGFESASECFKKGAPDFNIEDNIRDKNWIAYENLNSWPRPRPPWPKPRPKATFS